MEHLDWSQVLSLSAVLLTMGILGVLLRRRPIMVVLSLQLMWAACFIGLLACARYHYSASGQLNAIFVMTVAIVHAAIGVELAAVVEARRQGRAVQPGTMEPPS